MTTQPTTALGQRRFFTYESLRLDPARVWKHLSHCQYAASQVLRDLRVTWDREDDETLAIAFTNTQGEQFEAYWSETLDDPTNFDENDPASVTRYMLNQPGWTIERSLARVSNLAEMIDDDLVGMIDGRSVMVGDIWAALDAVIASVKVHSDRVYGVRNQHEALFLRQDDADVDAGQPGLDQVIAAERRVLAYEDYPIRLDNIASGLSPQEKAALLCMADLRIVWEENGYPSTSISFIAPNEFDYEADVVAVWEAEAEDRWDVEIHSNMTTRLMKRNDVYCTSPNGEKITFEDVAGVLIVLHEMMARCEADGYPTLEEQIV